MASNNSITLAISIFALFNILHLINAIDSNPIGDFVAPPNGQADGPYFGFQGLKEAFNGQVPPQVTPYRATAKEFPALAGHSIAMAIFRFPPAGVNPLHYHPRSAELMLVEEGNLEVGFVDTTNKVYTHTLTKGDNFLFPQGLIHYMANTDPNATATVVVSFASSNPGTVVVGASVFGSTFNPDILAKAFKVEPAVIQSLKTVCTLPPPPK